jgi:hypothetical protein
MVLGDVGDDVEQFVSAVSVASREPQQLGRLNADTGTVTGTVDIPTGRTLLAASRDTTHLLLADPTDTETWSPGHSQPTHLGPLYAEAAW